LKRIAFLGRGVHTIPSYRVLINRLSKEFEIKVFCETPIEKEWLEETRNYKLISWCTRFFPLEVNSILFFLQYCSFFL
jgi:hypothetical protein